MSEAQHTASCLCGAVQIEVTGALPAPDACHCTMCRKVSGHYWVSTDLASSAVTITAGEDNVTWYASSEKARRGFCKTCGAALFFDPLHHDYLAVAMGAFDGPTDTSVRVHIHVADKGDYYTLGDGVPQKDTH